MFQSLSNTFNNGIKTVKRSFNNGRDMINSGVNTVKSSITSFKGKDAKEKPYNSMNTIEVRRCYSEEDGEEEGYFVTPSYMSQAVNETFDLIGQGFRKRRNKNFKTVRVHPSEQSVFNGYFDLRDSDFDTSSIDRNAHVQNQMDYIQDVWIRYYREDLFKIVKERMKEVPQGRIVRLYLFLAIDMLYLSIHSNPGFFLYESNSGRNTIIKRRFTDEVIYDSIDCLWNDLRRRLESELSEFIPGTSGSAWTIHSHKFMDADMDIVADSRVRSYFKADKYVKDDICNVQNNDDYCLLYCYLKHLQKV